MIYLDRKQWPGLVAMTVLALLCLYLSKFPLVQNHGFSALILAIVIGMVLGNILPKIAQEPLLGGVGFAKHHALRVGIILYGFNLTFQDVLSIGWAGVLTDITVIMVVFFTGWWLGMRVFKLEANEAALIGAGSAVCGAAAVLATAPVVQAKSEHIAVAVATVVLFGTVCIIVYPPLITMMVAWGWLDGHALQQGLFIGSSVHEVAQVVAIGKAIDPATAQMAVIVKMVRVMMLAPFLMMVTLLFARQQCEEDRSERTRIAIPWFAFGFIAVAAFNSLHLLPQSIIAGIQSLDILLLCIAMVALGFTTQISVVKQAGLKPMILAGLLFILLLALSTSSIRLLHYFS